MIVEMARTWEADVIVVGSHGHNWVDRLLIGSVTEQLLNELPASLLVVPAVEPAAGRVEKASAARQPAAPARVRGVKPRRLKTAPN
jgi:hypothetical protein